MEMKRINRSPVVAIGYDEKNRRMVVELTTGTWEYRLTNPLDNPPAVMTVSRWLTVRMT